MSIIISEYIYDKTLYASPAFLFSATVQYSTVRYGTVQYGTTFRLYIYNIITKILHTRMNVLLHLLFF